MAKNTSSKSDRVSTGGSAAPKSLRNPKSTTAHKSIAASVLTQAPNRPKAGQNVTTEAISSKAGKFLAAGKLSYQSVKAGVSADVVRAFLKQGRLRISDVQMVIPTRTFERRLSEGQTLKIDEADSIARLLRVRDHALKVFEDADLAEEWLTLPNPELGNEIPIQMARTDVGAREVEAVLTRFEHGVYG